jgi:hypothetical protein
VDFKKFLPHLIAAGVLLVISMVFFLPNALGDKVLGQHDNQEARGMQAEVKKYLDKGETSPLWTNSAFGGMPAYQIYVKSETDLLRPAVRAPFLWQDMSEVWSQVFAAMLMLYFLLQVLGIDWRVSIVGALAYGITSYNVDILEAGHSTKMAALAFAPGMFAAAVLATRGRTWLGFGLLTFLTAAQVYVNHLQITYYTLLLIGLYFLSDLGWSFFKQKLPTWGVAALLTGVAVAIGFGTGAAKIWTTYEYGQETIRGKSDLAAKASKGDGLDKEYLFDWSCGVGESLTLLIPHYAGGGNNETFKDTKTYRQLPAEARRSTGAYLYTGDQPFVGTAIYFGAIVLFLALLGAILGENRFKWWLLGGGLFMVSLAWGKNFFLNFVWYDYLPMFNKFRAVTMAFGMAQLCFAALAAIGLHAVLSADHPSVAKLRALYIAAGSLLGVCLLALLMGPADGARDADIAAQSPQMLSLLAEDRAALLRADALRSMGFILAAAAVLWAYLRGILKSGVAVVLVGALALADHWLVCSRTLTSSDFTSGKTAKADPDPKDFDKKIMADPDPHFRVLDLVRGGITSNATNSYFHKSINGYHAAKLQRFQEVNEKYLGKDLNKNLHILGMMNTKYIIVPRGESGEQGEVMPNPTALGHAWFVQHVQVVPNADEELNALGTLNARDTVVLLEKNAQIAGAARNFERDSTDRIELSKYHPDRMEYTYSAKTDQIAVFPEQYYPPAKGWKCYLNDQPYEDFVKADYLLRAIRLPAGQNQKLEMRFEPNSFRTGTQVSLIASLLALLALGAGLFLFFKKNGTPEAVTALYDPEVTATPTTRAAAADAKKRK